VGRPVEVPELRLGGVALGVDVERERQLEELLGLVPVDLGRDVQTLGPAASVSVWTTVDDPNERATRTATAASVSALTDTSSASVRSVTVFR